MAISIAQKQALIDNLQLERAFDTSIHTFIHTYMHSPTHQPC